MKREFLKELGISEENINKILDQNSNDIGALKTSNEDLKKQIAEVNTKLESFNGVDVAGLKTQIETLKTDIANKQKEFDAKDAARVFDEKLNSLSAAYKPKNLKAVIPFLDIEKLKSSNDQEKDIKSAFESVKKDNGYLFEEDKKPFFSGSGSDKADHAAVNAAFRTYMGKGGN